MSGFLMGSVYYYQFTERQRRILLALADHGKDGGEDVRPSLDTLCWKLGIEDRTADRRDIQKTIRELETMGVLVPVSDKTGGRGKAVEYEMHLHAAPLRTTPPPSAGMRRIWEMLKSGSSTSLNDENSGTTTTVSDETNSGDSTALSANSGSATALKNRNRGTSTAVSAEMQKGRYFTHKKGGISPQKGGTATARTIIEPSYNHQEETARARAARMPTPLDEKNEKPEPNAEAEAEPPPIARRPPYDDRAFRRWALAQTGGWANLAPKRLDVMMERYCREKGIAI